jgi:hypothetical protein
MGGVPVHGEFTTGNCFFVSSVTGSDGNNGKKPSAAFATLDKATNACTANKHDIVYIMPNHAETIATSTTWVPDIAGVQYIGIGMGADAPELTFSATGSTIDVSGGNNLFRNIRFIAGISTITTGIDVNASHVTFDGCTWDFSTTEYDFVTMLDVDSFDYCTVKNCRFVAETTTTGCAAAIQIENSNNSGISNNIFTGNFSVSMINSTDAACENITVTDNVMYNDDTKAATSGGIQFTAANTGVIARNVIGWLAKAANIDLTIDPGSCMQFENYICSAIDTYGISTGIGSASSS